MKRRDFVKSSLAASPALLATMPTSLSSKAPVQAGQFVHCVYFWIREDLTEEERETFKQGLTMLANLETVRAGYIGTPPPSERDIVDGSYDYALVLAFDDSAGHDAYQEHPDHETFRQQTTGFWRDIKIYDLITQDLSQR